MKPMNEISSMQDIDRQRVVLLKQLYKQEKTVEHDYNVIADKWNRWLNIGSTATDFVLALIPKINFISSGFSIISRLFKKKK